MSRVLVIGGTGLLGAASALALAAAGDDVVLGSRHAPTAPELREFEHRPVDLDDLDVTALAGVDAVVLASGPDDRTPYPAPAEEYLREHLVRPTERLADACAAAGVRALVVLGSYFTAWQRENPAEPLAAHHPYVAARVEQSRVLAARADRLAIVVVEVPYVVGVGLGRYPAWLDVVLDNAVLHGLPFVVYPAGGATATTVDQVGSAVAAAVHRGLGRAPGIEAFAVGERVLTWAELFAGLGAGMGRRLRQVPVPGALARLPARSLARSARRQGQYLGIDPAQIITDAVARTTAVDLGPGRTALRYVHADLTRALHDSGAAYAAAHSHR